jgi:hypothetical protein
MPCASVCKKPASAPDNHSQVIQTKLYRPQAGADLVQRPHLLDRLEQGLSRELILVSAPAGSGKTTLASQWLAVCGRRMSKSVSTARVAHSTSLCYDQVRQLTAWGAYPQSCFTTCFGPSNCLW